MRLVKVVPDADVSGNQMSGNQNLPQNFWSYSKLTDVERNLKKLALIFHDAFAFVILFKSIKNSF